MISCKEYAAKRKQEITEEIKSMSNHIPPSLAIIQVGDDFASSKYTTFKIKDCNEVGIKPVYIHLKKETTSEELDQAILDISTKVDGIIVQLPLPDHIKFDKNIIPADLDVDGFRDNSIYEPCTPKGIISILAANGYDNLSGLNVVVIGRGELVGKPLVQMLLDKNATVTICHSHTTRSDLKDLCMQADIIISAVGKPHIVTKDMVKSNAFIVDAGVSRDNNGKVIGDCDYEDLKDVVEFITPPTGGVGVMTRLSLLENVMESWRYYVKIWGD